MTLPPAYTPKGVSMTHKQIIGWSISNKGGGCGERK